VARIRKRDGCLHRFCVANLAHENNVWRLAHRVL
jgi:hypothetical protein